MNSTLVVEAHDRLKAIVTKTPLERHSGLSVRFGADIYLKREDLQVVRSYKLRGAYNRISLLNDDERQSVAQGTHVIVFVSSPKERLRQKTTIVR